MQRIAAVVVTYNRLPQLKRTLERLLNEPVDRILVVDNASTDETRKWLKEQSDSRLRTVFAEANLGGAGGFALGMKTASAEGPDWIVVMDDDARPEPGAISEFRKALPTECDSVAAAVFYPTGGICEMNMIYHYLNKAF